METSEATVNSSGNHSWIPIGHTSFNTVYRELDGFGMEELSSEVQPLVLWKCQGALSAVSHDLYIELLPIQA